MPEITETFDAEIPAGNAASKPAAMVSPVPDEMTPLAPPTPKLVIVQLMDDDSTVQVVPQGVSRFAVPTLLRAAAAKYEAGLSQ